MAITAAKKLSDFSGLLTPEQSAPIFDEVARTSVVQRLARQIPLGASGQAIPMVTSKPMAGWVAEGAQKPASNGGMELITMAPKKLAAISVMSTEVFRANPGGYATALRGHFAEAFATAFDSAAIHGTNTPFDAYMAQTSHSVEFGTAASVYLDIVSGLEALVNDGKRLSSFAFDLVAEPILLSAVDGNDRPLLTPSPADGVYANIIGRPTVLEAGVAGGSTIGLAGDFNKAAWGVVGGISYNVSTEATVTINGELVSLWENNLVAVLAEAEYGFSIADVDNFVTFTESTIS